MPQPGALTSSDAYPRLRPAGRDGIEGGARRIVLNLRDVSDIDSFGVAALASTHMSAANRGGRVVLTELTRKLQHLFAITRLNTVFEIFGTEAEALASYVD